MNTKQKDNGILRLSDLSLAVLKIFKNLERYHTNLKDHSNVDQFAKKKKKKNPRRPNEKRVVYFNYNSSSILTFMIFKISLTILV